MNEPAPSIATGNGRGLLRLPILIGAVTLAAIAIFAAQHYRRPDPPTEPTAPGMTVGKTSVTLAPTAPAWSVVKIGAPEATGPHWTDPSPARIVFDEARTSRLGSPLAGRVTAVMIERGQHVKTGAPLFTVSSPNLADLRNELAKATIERATARTNLERVQALVDAGSLPAKELVTAKQELAEQELAVRVSDQKLASLKVVGAGDASFTVTAPRDGVVVEKNLSVGSQVDSSTGSLIAIADLSDVWVVADVFETDVGSIAPGVKAQVTIGGNVELDGLVEQVSGVVDPDRHTVPVRIKLANADGALRPNAYAQIRFFDPTTAKVSLPASAVISDGAVSYVYVQRVTGKLEKREVTVGSITSGRVPVLAGIEPSEQVVLQGAILLDNQIELDN